MTIDANQLRNDVIIPSISAIGLYSEDAVELLMLTAAMESKLGSYIRQVGMTGNDGAFGIFQMEAKTYNRLYDQLITTNTSRSAKLKAYLGYESKPSVQRLITDMALAAIMARLLYFDIQASLPPHDNVPAMAAYYKHWYNTKLGAATPDKAIQAYQNLVLKS